MAAAFLNNAHKEFQLTLDELQNSLDFVRLASRLRPRLGKFLAWDHLDAEGKTLVKSFMHQRSVHIETIYNGLFVALAGAFEDYVRRLVQDTITALNVPSKSFDSLSERIRNQNVARTGEALATVHQPLDYLDFDYELLAKNLATCVKGADTYTLNAQAFTISISGASQRQIEESAKRLGFDLNWNHLGAARSLQTVLNTEGAQQTGSKLKEYLQSFTRTRNKIAHSGGRGVAIGDTELEHGITFFRAFAAPLRDVLGQNANI
jgi:hypothetical protein